MSNVEKSRKAKMPGRAGNAERKKPKGRKMQEMLKWPWEKVQKGKEEEVEKLERRKISNSRRLFEDFFDFLTFCEKFRDFQVVLIPSLRSP